MIIGTTADAIIPHILMAETSVEAWATLMDLYDIDDIALILKLQHQLSYLGKNEGDNVQDHIMKDDSGEGPVGFYWSRG